MTLMLHCGGQPASFEDICSIEVPNNTDTYRAVPHGDIVRLIEDRVGKETGLDQPERRFGLNREGHQMFGTLSYSLGDWNNHGVDLTAFGDRIEDISKQYAFTVGFRNSYDKSMSVGIAIGTSVFACDNLALHGNWLTILKRHTRKVWDSIVPAVMTRIATAPQDWVRQVTLLETMKDKEVHLEEGYRNIGLALGRGILTPNQGSKAMKEWRATNRKDDHVHADFKNTAFGLYQSFTESLKLGSVPRKIDQYCGTSALFDELGYTTVEDAEIVH